MVSEERGLLLDTHVFLWSFREPERLPRKVADLLTTEEMQGFLSVVSLWEIALKIRTGKIDMPIDPNFYEARMAALKLRPLSLETWHVNRVFSLPDHHRDPFDRILVAQAMVEDLVVVTGDPFFRHYEVKVFW